MNFLVSLIGYLCSIPARAKGMKFGKKSYIGWGYDFLFSSMKGVIIDDDVLIGRDAWIQTINNNDTNRDGPIISIGKSSRIGRSVTISCKKKITIGEKCLISYNVSILDHDHYCYELRSPVESGLTDGEEIIIRDDCFIGAHSFILKGVQLGKHCVVGANCVVTKSFPDYSLIAGNPAKLVKNIKCQTSEQFS